MKECIWLKNINKDYISLFKEQNPYCLDEDINTMQELLDEYGHNKAFAMLLGGQAWVKC